MKLLKMHDANDVGNDSSFGACFLHLWRQRKVQESILTFWKLELHLGINYCR